MSIQKNACSCPAIKCCQGFRFSIHGGGLGETISLKSAAAFEPLMNHLARLLFFPLIALTGSALAGPVAELQPGPTPASEEQNSRDLFAYETDYTSESDLTKHTGK